MEGFTNVNIKKEKKRVTRNVWISLGVIIIAILFAFWGYYEVEQAFENAQNLNDILVSEDTTKEDKVAYIDVSVNPYMFAEETEGVNGYFIVMDDQYMYIAYMSKYAEIINKTDLKENPTRITGGTKLISRDVKEMALDAYNEGVEEEDKLTMADFTSYFGDVYLDVTDNGTSEIGSIQTLLGFIFGLFGIVMFIIMIVRKVKFSKNIKNMDSVTIETLDNEMNSSEAFYYASIHLYLTNNYVINFQNTFKVIEYKDIIWMYSMIYRTNGIKTRQSIKVMTKDGKTYEIAAIDVTTKAKKEMYEEIWNTIIAKNNQVILGFTAEAQEQAKERIEK